MSVGACQQLFDRHKIPLATSTLSLYLEFDLTDVSDHASLRAKDHQAACDEACRVSGLRPPSVVVARALTTHKAGDIEEAHSLPYYSDPWLTDPAHEIRIEFLYSLSFPRLTIRVLNELSKCDGVVALRTALHTLEALGGGPIGGGAPFKTNPPFRFGVRHLLNLLRTIVPCVIASQWPFTRAVVSADELGAPTTMSGVRAYYRQARPPLARFRLYRSPTAGGRAYKELISVLEIWKQRMHWRGFFTLQNMSRLGSSPAVAPAVVPNSRDLLNMETRYRHIFIPPGFPPSGQTWTSMNYLHAKVLFVNNYGIHDVHTKARATAFLWDWIGVAAHVAGTGCITVNGQFLVWARGTPAGLEKGQDLYQAALGGPPYLELEQYRGPRQ